MPLNVIFCILEDEFLTSTVQKKLILKNQVQLVIGLPEDLQ